MSRQIADALEAHFVHPDDPTSGVVLREVTAPGSSRRIDVLAVSLWASRGYGIDAVEIKTDRADYQREIANPAKAEPWWKHSNRFWIAAPTTLIADPNQLPPGWGLLVPGNGRRFKIVVKAAERPLEAGMPLFAAILGRHVNVTHDRHQQRLREQREQMRRDHEQTIRAVRQEAATAGDPETRRALDVIKAVQAGAGIELGTFSHDDTFTPEELGQAIRTALAMQRASRSIQRDLQALGQQIEWAIGHLGRTAETLTKEIAPELKAAAEVSL